MTCDISFSVISIRMFVESMIGYIIITHGILNCCIIHKVVQTQLYSTTKPVQEQILPKTNTMTKIIITFSPITNTI